DDTNTTSDGFTYSVADPTGNTLSGQTFAITVTPNVAPIAVADSYTVNEGGAENLNLAVNDSDADNGLDLTSITIVSNPTNGVVAVNSDGTVEYTHDGGETLSDSFAYSINDLSGATSNFVNVSLTINPVNDAPVVISNAPTAVFEETAYDYAVATSDPDSEASLTITATTLPSWLTLVDNGDGTATLSGTPTHAEVGDHSVVIQVSDGATVTTQRFTVQVTGETDDSSDQGGVTGSGSEFDDSPTGEQDDPVDETPAEETITSDDSPESTDEYLTPQNSTFEEDDLLSSEEVPDIIFLTDENDTNASKGRGGKPGWIYFDNDLDKESVAESDPVGGMDIASETWEQMLNHEDYDRLREDIDKTFRSEQHAKEVKIKIATASMTIFTIGIVSFLTRFGSLVTGMVSTLPLWRSFDPIVILSGKREDQKEKNQQVKGSEQPTETLFEPGEQ
ncbi:MAG: Ig-like domain-containing protein, partial [Desulfobacteraceae bacterium]